MRTRSRAKSLRAAVGRHVGRILRDLRKGKGLSVKEVWARQTYYKDQRSIRRLEEGHRPPREWLIKILRSGFEIDDVAEINRVLTQAQYAELSTNEEFEHKL